MPMMKETMLKRLLLPIAAAGGGGSAPVQDTATGNPLVFFTDLARPLKSMLVPFTPIQEGTGDPSPQNIRPITGWDAVNVEHAGTNIFDESTVTFGKWTASDGTVSDSYGGCISADIIVRSGVKVTFWFNGVRPYSASIIEKTANGQFIKRNHVALANIENPVPYTVTLSETTGIINLQVYAHASSDTMTADVLASEKVQLNFGNTATTYEPYKPITETSISFPSHVYGGTLDVVSGVLTVEWAKTSATWMDCQPGSVTPETGLVSGHLDFTESVVQCTSGVDYGKNTICNVCGKVIWGNASYTPAHYYINAQGRVWIALPQDTPNDTVIEVYAKLATTVEIQLTPAQLTAIIGNNTIWSDADGEMTATYLKKA